MGIVISWMVEVTLCLVGWYGMVQELSGVRHEVGNIAHVRGQREENDVETCGKHLPRNVKHDL